jgi:hypothetical protein
MEERRLHRIVRQIEEGMKGKVKFGNGIVVQAFMELFTHLPAALQDAMNRKSTMAGYENSGIAGYGTTHTRLHTRTHINTHTHTHVPVHMHTMHARIVCDATESVLRVSVRPRKRTHTHTRTQVRRGAPTA